MICSSLSLRSCVHIYRFTVTSFQVLQHQTHCVGIQLGQVLSHVQHTAWDATAVPSRSNLLSAASPCHRWWTVTRKLPQWKFRNLETEFTFHRSPAYKAAHSTPPPATPQHRTCCPRPPAHRIQSRAPTACAVCLSTTSSTWSTVSSTQSTTSNTYSAHRTYRQAMGK
jgi:hypothetical protein